MIAKQLSTIISVQTDEIETVVSVGMLFAVLEAGRSLAWNTADAMLFHRFGVDVMPFLFISLGSISALTILTYAVCLRHFDKTSFYRVLFLLFGFILVAERAIVALDLPLLYPVVWLTINILNALLAAIMWSLAMDACETRQAGRVFSLFASAGILGSIIGNLLTGPLDRMLGTENLIILYAGLLMVGMSLINSILQQSDSRRPAWQTHASVWASLSDGFDIVRGSKLLHLVACSSLLTTLLFFSFSFPFNKVVAASFATEGEVANFLGTFSAIVTGATFLVSFFAAKRLLRQIGVANTALILPFTYLIGFGLLAANSSLAVAIIARLAQMTVHVGLGVSAFNLFFNAVPPQHRNQVLSFNCAVPKQLGVVLSGVLLVLVERALDIHMLLAMGMVLALVCAYLLWQARTEYRMAPAQA
jgi:ATP/ADP translocase